jgi:hypothetical protein
MKPAKLGLIFATVACVVGLNVRAAEATPFSVNVVLDHLDLSDANPINWSVTFPPIFNEIRQVTVDAYWVDDGLDPGETIVYRGVLNPGSGEFGYSGIGTTVFFRRIVVTGPPLAFMHLLDGSAQGLIATTATSSPPNEQPTSVTYDRLVFTFEGTVVPEPGTLLLLATGILAGARKLQRPARSASNPPRPSSIS